MPLAGGVAAWWADILFGYGILLARLSDRRGRAKPVPTTPFRRSGLSQLHHAQPPELDGQVLQRK